MSLKNWLIEYKLPLTICMCNKSFSGYSSAVARSNFRVVTGYYSSIPYGTSSQPLASI